MSDRTLPFTVNFDWSFSKFGKTAMLRFNGAKQLNRRRHIQPVCLVNVSRQILTENLSLTCLLTHWYIHVLLLTSQGLPERIGILVKIAKADWSILERLLLLNV